MTDSAGIKHDGAKIRIDLFPGDALFAISQVLSFGAIKYADRNWELGMKWGRVFGALMRHMWCWWQGKAPTNTSFVFGTLDEETKFSHLWHAGCCIVFLIAYEERQVGEDDRPTYNNYNKDVNDKPVFTDPVPAGVGQVTILPLGAGATAQGIVDGDGRAVHSEHSVTSPSCTPRRRYSLNG